MTDRELLELAAKAAGIHLSGIGEDGEAERQDGGWWNPLTDDGDGLRLAICLRIDVYPWIHDSVDDVSAMARTPHGQRFIEFKADSEGCKYAATRRAITRAAAEIGRAMK